MGTAQHLHPRYVTRAATKEQDKQEKGARAEGRTLEIGRAKLRHAKANKHTHTHARTLESV